jgi:hypothetical protein
MGSVALMTEPNAEMGQPVEGIGPNELGPVILVTREEEVDAPRRWLLPVLRRLPRLTSAAVTTAHGTICQLLMLLCSSLKLTARDRPGPAPVPVRCELLAGRRPRWLLTIDLSRPSRSTNVAQEQ